MMEKFNISKLYGECPCQRCGDRRIGCHGACGRYRAWKERRDETRHRIGQEHLAETYMKDMNMRIKSRIWKMKRKSGR